MNNGIIILKDVKNTGELVDNIKFLKETIKNLDHTSEDSVQKFYHNYISQILAGGIRGEHHYLNVLLLWINTTTYYADDVIDYFCDWISNPDKRKLATQTIYNWYRDCEYNNYQWAVTKIKGAICAANRVDDFISHFNNNFSWYLYGSQKTTNRAAENASLSLEEFYHGLPDEIHIGVQI